MIKKEKSSESKTHKRHPGIRPSLTRCQKIDAVIRWMVPLGFNLFVILIFSVPLNIPGRNELLLAIVISSVYFWSIYRPTSMPAIGVFFLGFLIDLLNFSSPGVVIFILLIVYGMAIMQRFRLARYNFLIVWLIFAIIALSVFFIQWLLISLLSLKLVSVSYFIFEMVFAIGFYPLLSIMFTWAHRTIADPEQV
ncbi:hypothetical protein [Commensalibacter melissae]|uniref:hypothetical protein n=1 Tax=Commensalibacter melissae TaxID=2070537 RepID=UPI001E29486E|nr:hypothetical protein [Commensalibacter melissae]